MQHHDLAVATPVLDIETQHDARNMTRMSRAFDKHLKQAEKRRKKAASNVVKSEGGGMDLYSRQSRDLLMTIGGDKEQKNTNRNSREKKSSSKKRSTSKVSFSETRFADVIMNNVGDQTTANIKTNRRSVIYIDLEDQVLNPNAKCQQNSSHTDMQHSTNNSETSTRSFLGETISTVDEEKVSYGCSEDFESISEMLSDDDHVPENVLLRSCSPKSLDPDAYLWNKNSRGNKMSLGSLPVAGKQDKDDTSALLTNKHPGEPKGILVNKHCLLNANLSTSTTASNAESLTAQSVKGASSSSAETKCKEAEGPEQQCKAAAERNTRVLKSLSEDAMLGTSEDVSSETNNDVNSTTWLSNLWPSFVGIFSPSVATNKPVQDVESLPAVAKQNDNSIPATLLEGPPQNQSVLSSAHVLGSEQTGNSMLSIGIQATPKTLSSGNMSSGFYEVALCADHNLPSATQYNLAPKPKSFGTISSTNSNSPPAVVTEATASVSVSVPEQHNVEVDPVPQEGIVLTPPVLHKTEETVTPSVVAPQTAEADPTAVRATKSSQRNPLEEAAYRLRRLVFD